MTSQLKDPYDSTTFGNALSLRVDGAIGAMSLSPNGRDAVLAGRRGLFIIDLDDPFTTPRWLHHITSWEVADVQWSPHHSVKPSWCISTSNQKALLWDLSRPSNNAISNVLHQHTRAITDINFHPSDPEILATCSIDTFIMGWDMRTPRRPVVKWAEWRAGATQAKWNHVNPYEIASSHDNCFYIWDSRKGALPLLKVNKAHNGKINCLDFSNGMSNIITCSNDKTVKFWNLKTQGAKEYANNFNFFDSKSTNSSLSPAVVINTDYPIARARSLPFGKDKACGIMPLRGGQDAIHIVNYDSAYRLAIESGQTQEINSDPIQSFKGHNGAMKDFLWRTRRESYEGFDSKQKWKDFQLVTWSSQDYDLKLWPHDEELYKKVNYNPSYQKILDVFTNGESDSEDISRSQSPGIEHNEESDNKKNTMYKYETYCIEPPVTIEDLKRNKNGDMLSSLTLYQIAENHRLNGHSVSQLNHLDWISGVRMGRAGHDSGRKDSNSNSIDEEDGPSNFGEEISIVGHKFPKVRFEKISVSTGEIVISLRGPIPNIDTNSLNKVGSINTDNNDDHNNSEINASNDKDAINDQEKPNKTDISLNTNSNNNNTSVLSNDVNDLDDNASKNNPTNTASINDDSSQEQKLIFIRIEIKFPKSYPYIHHAKPDTSNSSKKLAKLQKSNLVKFNIEETHELTSIVKNEMLKDLNEISQFYTNKYQKFCLEPCLRYLMGDKIDLDDSLMVDRNRNNSNDNKLVDGDIDQEIGTEGWADDLINQQPDMERNQLQDDSSGEEDGDEYADLIPAINEDEILNSIDSLDKNSSDIGMDKKTKQLNSSIEKDPNQDSSNKTFFDSTPVPKGCGAIWSPTGQLVCFFIPKNNEEEENKELQKFNIFKFANGGFSLSTHSNHHHHQHHKISSGSFSDTLESEPDNDSDNLNYSDSPNLNSDLDDSKSITSSSSDDSFTNDWDEILQGDVPSRSRIPGLFKTSVGLGNRYISLGNNKTSLNRFTSHGGTTSNYKSSVPGDTTQFSKKKKNRSNKKNKNILGIFDFRHLLPEKYELACEYKVLGDSPENLARYNSGVALKYGFKEISDVWKILEMVLTKDVDINSINSVPYLRNIDLHSSSKNLEAINQLIQSAAVTKRIVKNKNHKFYWGTNPFGHSWLIKEIFKYFEKKGNIQMLAMLSCILYENSNNINKINSNLFNIPIHTPYQVLPPPPSVIDMRQFNENNQQTNYSHQRDILNYSFNDPISTEQRVQGCANNKLISSSLSTLKRYQQSVNSPNYAKSIGSMLDMNSWKDASPERFSYLKKNIQHTSSYTPLNEFLLPNELPKDPYMIHSPKQRFSQSKTTTYLNEDQKKQKSIQNYSKKQTVKLKNNVRQPPLVTIDMQNTEGLDLFDDVYTSSLLHSQDELKIKGYREQYADMLYVWGLPINRIKILKFNYPEVDDRSGKQHDSFFDVHRCSFGLRYKHKQNLNQQLITSTTQISITKNSAWNTNRKTLLKYCNLCNLMVTKSLVVCTNCEHILHSHCAVEWWSNNEDNEEINQECPSGCGCKCLEYRI